MERFAVIADIHGNRWALEAVLEDIARRGIRHIFNAGDHLFGPLDPTGTADLLIRLDLWSVAGNQDRELLDDTPAEPGSTLEKNRMALSPAHREWLSGLLPQLELPGDILMFHGTPERDDVYLLESVRTGGVVSLAATEEIVRRLGAVHQTLLLCGHSHIPRVVEWEGRLIVNPGSVGLQAYADGTPAPHAMETGSPLARYAIVEPRETGRNVELAAIAYDAEAAARTAERNGRPDWAWRLRTGRAFSG
jgi:predicted phosphodiesterase